MFADFNFKFHASVADLFFHDMLHLILIRIEWALDFLAHVCVTSAFDPGVNLVVFVLAHGPVSVHMLLCFMLISMRVEGCRVDNGDSIVTQDEPDEEVTNDSAAGARASFPQ